MLEEYVKEKENKGEHYSPKQSTTRISNTRNSNKKNKSNLFQIHAIQK